MAVLGRDSFLFRLVRFLVKGKFADLQNSSLVTFIYQSRLTQPLSATATLRFGLQIFGDLGGSSVFFRRLRDGVTIPVVDANTIFVFESLFVDNTLGL
jgi:hypothetical protein